VGVVLKGWILGCDSSGGAISTDAGERFKFAISEWKGPGWPAARDEVDFIGANGAATEIYPAIVIGAARTGTGSAAGFAPVVPAMATPAAFLSAAPSEPMAAPSAFYQPAPQPIRKKVGPFRAIGLAYWQNLRNFWGRSSRAEFWWVSIIIFLVLVSITVFYLRYCYEIGIECQNPAGTDGNATVDACINRRVSDFAEVYISGAAKVLAFLWAPTIGLSVRRLHDTGRSGWRYLLIFTGIGAIPLFFWLLAKGDPGPNKYGADPLIQAQAV